MRPLLAAALRAQPLIGARAGIKRATSILELRGLLEQEHVDLRSAAVVWQQLQDLDGCERARDVEIQTSAAIGTLCTITARCLDQDPTPLPRDYFDLAWSYSIMFTSITQLEVNRTPFANKDNRMTRVPAELVSRVQQVLVQVSPGLTAQGVAFVVAGLARTQFDREPKLLSVRPTRQSDGHESLRFLDGDIRSTGHLTHRPCAGCA